MDGKQKFGNLSVISIWHDFEARLCQRPKSKKRETNYPKLLNRLAFNGKKQIIDEDKFQEGQIALWDFYRKKNWQFPKGKLAAKVIRCAIWKWDRVNFRQRYGFGNDHKKPKITIHPDESDPDHPDLPFIRMASMQRWQLAEVPIGKKHTGQVVFPLPAGGYVTPNPENTISLDAPITDVKGNIKQNTSSGGYDEVYDRVQVDKHSDNGFFEVIQMIKTLPINHVQKQVLFLKIIGYTIRDISQLVKLPRSTVQNSLDEARNIARDEILKN